ncbi:Hemolymph lipopolysaccharide-binding protein [Eumeta japonica]|uniref:Hemolymph lipopolysaccharide-binding protein n=1 Tax=Eumeta variegata TaxID=151549 RepID=A0A4C1UF34_EUMVA|nr:Hemolymph lipopolysaccharide-binding protein [Eumeta japonica]
MRAVYIHDDIIEGVTSFRSLFCATVRSRAVVDMWVIFIASVICTRMQCTATASSTSQSHRPDGYRRVSEDGLYKVHAEPRSWNDAYTYCALEDAVLFYPKTLAEAKLVAELLQEKFPKGAESWVGAHDLFTPSSFVDLDGTEISSYFAPWGPNEPNHGGWYGTCVMMHPQGFIDDQQCAAWRPFACKKAINNTKTFNSECDTYDADASFTSSPPPLPIKAQPGTFSTFLGAVTRRDLFLI